MNPEDLSDKELERVFNAARQVRIAYLKKLSAEQRNALSGKYLAVRGDKVIVFNSELEVQAYVDTLGAHETIACCKFTDC